jgi:hypothetical protein
MIHLTTVRELSPEGFEESVLPFLKKKEHAEAFDRNVAKFNRWVARRGGPQGPAPAHGPVVQAKWHGSDGFDETRERKTREESPPGKKLMARLEDLRKELKKAEKQAEEYRGRKKDAKQKKSPLKGDGKDRRSKKSRSARSRSHRKKGCGAKSTSRLRRRRSGRKDKSKSRRRRRRKKNPPGLKTLENPVQLKKKGSSRPRSVAERRAPLPGTEALSERDRRWTTEVMMVQALKIRIFKKPLEIHEKLATEATQLQQKVPRETRQPDVAENVPGHGEGSRGGVKAKDAASSYEPSLDGSPALSPVQDRDEDAPRDEDVGATGRTRSRSAGPVPEGFREGDGGGPLEQCAISGASSSRVIDTVGA